MLLAKEGYAIMMHPRRLKINVVATFTPRGSHILNAIRFTHSLLLAVSLAAVRRSATRDRYDRHCYCASICC